MQKSIQITPFRLSVIVSLAFIGGAALAALFYNPAIISARDTGITMEAVDAMFWVKVFSVAVVVGVLMFGAIAQWVQKK